MKRFNIYAFNLIAPFALLYLAFDWCRRKLRRMTTGPT